MDNYLGPTIRKNKNKSFCKNFLPKDGFVKVDFIDIIDGDTAYFKINGFSESVRFMVINAPQVYPTAEPFGIEAKDYAYNLLNNAKEIYLESDKFNNLYDDTLNKRLLAWIWVDGKLLNYLIVKAGLATNKYIINPNMKYLDYLDEALNYAKSNKLGLHQDI